MQPEEKEFQKSLWQQFESVLDRPSASALHRAAACRGLLQRVNVAYAFHQLNGGSAFQLLQKYGEKYASILDSKDQETGLDNHIAHIVALGGRQKMENKQWHSSLTLDCLRNMECVSNFLKGSGTPSRMIGLCHWEYPETTDGYSSEAVPCNTKMGDAMEGVIADPNSYCNSDRFCVGSTNSSLESSDVHFTSAMSFKRTKKPLTAAAASFTNAQNLVAPEPAVPFVLRNANMQVKRKASEVSDNADLSDEQFEEIDSKSERNNRVATNTFKTARQQLATVQAKRQGRNTAAAQGLSKKSLGTAKPRGPFGRFVSPVLKSEGSEGSTNMCAKEYDANGDQCFDEQLKNVDSKMVDVILGEILDRGPPVDWDDISGLDFAKATIKEIVVWPMLRPDIFTGLRGPPKGLLLFGPPGTGKTLIGKCIASQSGATFFSVSASTLTSKWVGEGEKLVKALFAVAHARQPAVIFVDEIDALLSRRRGDGTEHEASRRMKTEFLVQMDGAATEAEDRVLVVGATNRPQEIDEAARRRLAKRLYIPLPCAVARRGIVQKLLEQQQCSVGEQDFRRIVERSEGFSGADVSLLCREAAMGPVRELSDIATVSADTMRSIEYRDFDTALSVVRPSVSYEDLEVYVNWDKQFGCGR